MSNITTDTSTFKLPFLTRPHAACLPTTYRAVSHPYPCLPGPPSQERPDHSGLPASSRLGLNFSSGYPRLHRIASGIVLILDNYGLHAIRYTSHRLDPDISYHAWFAHDLLPMKPVATVRYHQDTRQLRLHTIRSTSYYF